MKILHIIPYFSPKFGGDVTSVYELSTHLAKRGHTVSIVTTSYLFDKKLANETLGVEIIPIPYFLYWELFIYSPRINRFLEENLNFFDLVVLHNYRSYQNACLMKYAKIYSVPYCLDAHGSFVPIWGKKIRKRLFDLVWGNKILRGASKLIAATPQEKYQYIKNGIDPKKIFIIPRGINISKYNTYITDNHFRQKYNISSNAFLILYLGRIHPIKGLDILINAFSRLTKTYENTFLVVAGPDDGYLLDLQNFISQNNIGKKVLFTGTLNFDEKIIALKSVDLVVVPSYFESFGKVITEAMASKTPILISNNCGILQMISEEVVHVCECDKEKFYTAMEKLYLDENERKKYLNPAYDYIETHFSWDNVIQQYEVLFESIIRDRQID
jgi:glycosyltransferase involved in cell wall biosynthesis